MSPLLEELTLSLKVGSKTRMIDLMVQIRDKPIEKTHIHHMTI